MPKCGVMVCDLATIVHNLPHKTFTVGQTEIGRVFEYKYLGISALRMEGRTRTLSICLP